MTPLRTVFALTLAAGLTLPYASPVLCTALEPDMNMVDCGAETHAPAQQMQDRCDAPGCATAPVAPIATLMLVSVGPATVGGSPISSPDAPLETQAAPLIPPPRA